MFDNDFFFTSLFFYLIRTFLLYFSPTYRGKVLEGKVAEAAEEKPFFGKERVTKETGFHSLRSGARGICGRHVVTLKPF